MERTEETGAYYTIRSKGFGEYEEKRSRFLGEAIPITSAEEAAGHLERIRRQYYDARHHCSAWILGEKRDIRKTSDDGEPSGTAGLPMLKVMDGLQCTNAMVVVTRYFGGTLLGTGGLVRAYSAAARLALEQAEVVCMRRGEILELCMEYSLLSSVQYYLDTEGLRTLGTEYTDRVFVRVAVPEERCPAFREKMQALSGGRMEVRTAEKGFYGF